MSESGGAARRLAFARDDPHRAIVELAVDGVPQVHSWDLRTDRVVTATTGSVRAGTISPDGQWVWWYETREQLWLRRPFGASPRTRPDRPLRLRPAAGVAVAIGGDGTAVVGRSIPGIGHTFTLMPVGRVRPGAEPTFLCSVPEVVSFHRSRDDALVAIDTGTDVLVHSARTGAPVAQEPTQGKWTLLGFTHDGALLFADTTDSAGAGSPDAGSAGAGSPGAEAPGRVHALRLWHPATALRRVVSLAGVEHPTRAELSWEGNAVILEARLGDDGGQSAQGGQAAHHVQTPADARRLYTLTLDGSQPAPAGPDHGWITAGSGHGGPGGSVYGLWSAPGLPTRLVDVAAVDEPTADETAPTGAPTDQELHRRYAPIVGGYGARSGN